MVLFTSMLLIACGDNSNKVDNTVPAVQNAPLVPLMNPQIPGDDTSGQKKTETGLALNPQHGQPGHRCDIPVGSPLNSSANAAPIVAAPPVNTTNIPTIGTSTTELKYNPKHGEPGHRCDLAEGAPLDGKKQ